MKPRIVSDWRKCWRYYSTQALALLALMPVVWEQLPPEAQMMLPPEWRPWALAALALGGLAGRLVSQEPKSQSQLKGK